VFINGTRWFVSPYNPILTKQKQNIIAGSILDRNYIVLAQSDEEGDRQYHPDARVRRALCHTVGDPYGIAASGIESFYAQYLLGFNGNVFERIYQTLSGEKRRGDSVVTTLDCELSAYAYDVLDGKSGSIVVMNYKTGEILTSVSSPGFDPVTLNKNETLEDSGKSYLVNRATMGRYTPGSVFKLVTAAAVLEYDQSLLQKKYVCTGEVKYKNGSVVCANDAVHGELTLAQAMAESCNCVFAQVAQDLGPDAIARMAKKMGYEEEFLFDDLILYKSRFTQADNGTLDAAWASVGQHLTTASPLHVAMITAAIANDGVMMEPKLIKSIMNVRQFEYKKLKSETIRRVVSSESAKTLREMMEMTVKSGTATRAAIKGYTVGGKTGSAQVSENSSTRTHAWFTGYVYSDEHPLCIVVMIELGGSGGSVAAPIAQKVLQRAIGLGL
jgi:peptidoglycan glycosyltransferase